MLPVARHYTKFSRTKRADLAAYADDAIAVAMPAARIDGKHVHARCDRFVEDDFREVGRVADDPSLRHALVAVVRPLLKPHALVFLGGVHGDLVSRNVAIVGVLPVSMLPIAIATGTTVPIDGFWHGYR